MKSSTDTYKQHLLTMDLRTLMIHVIINEQLNIFDGFYTSHELDDFLEDKAIDWDFYSFLPFDIRQYILDHKDIANRVLDYSADVALELYNKTAWGIES